MARRADGTCQRRAQGSSFALIEGRADHRAALALQAAMTLSAVILRISRKSAALPDCRLCAASFMNLSLMPTSESVPPRAPEAAPIAAPASGIRKIMPIKRAPEGSGGGAGRGRVEQLIEFDMAIGLLDRDNRVAQLDQVLLLHIEQLLANLLGLFFGRKGDFHEIGHLCLLRCFRV